MRLAIETVVHLAHSFSVALDSLGNQLAGDNAGGFSTWTTLGLELQQLAAERIRHHMVFLRAVPVALWCSGHLYAIPIY